METVPIPGGTLVEKAFPRVDYADACRTSASELARRMLAGRSRMGGRLLRIRDALVRPFGVQPAHRGSSEVRIEAGGARGPFHALEVVAAAFDPGGSTGDEPYTHGDSEELLLVLAGRIHLQLGSELLDLSAGDSVNYRSSTAHRVSNPGAEPAEVLFVISPPSY